MSTRPRTPARAAPAPGKLRLPELLELKPGRPDHHGHCLRRPGSPADEAGVELILVGDSAAMVMLGHESTLPVTLDEMVF
jgi:3-methyl-2-oxobutanoate hydroxymethyltransferase